MSVIRGDVRVLYVPKMTRLLLPYFWASCVQMLWN